MVAGMAERSFGEGGGVWVTKFLKEHSLLNDTLCVECIIVYIKVLSNKLVEQ